MEHNMTWEYLPVLNKLLQILVTIAIGIGAGILGAFPADQFVPQAVSFVFNIALPCLISKGIGIGIDFYAETNIWEFIVAFLILRAIALLLALLSVLLTNWKEKSRAYGVGYVAVLWLSLTWISTVILGIPISTAVFGNPKLGVKYGILAGISSFIFQLPLQLLFLECHVAEEEGSRSSVHIDQPVDPLSQTKDHTMVTIQVTPDSSSHANEGTGTEDQRNWGSLVHSKQLSNASLWRKIANGLISNPVLWGIIVGFILSLSTAGKYLRCPSETCILGLEWIGATLGWLGECVSPVSLFAMGLWMHDQASRQQFSMQMWRLSMHMISKLIVVPLIMVALAKAMRLNNEAGRAAILIATLPISMASFSLGRRYNIGEKDLATNVIGGTLLMLPTVLIWNLVLDNVGLYPITPTS